MTDWLDSALEMVSEALNLRGCKYSLYLGSLYSTRSKRTALQGKGLL